MIDAHHHLWEYTAEDHPWIDHTMTKIRRDFKGEDLAEILVQNRVTGTVLVQVNQSEAETIWLIEQSNKHSFILGVVGWVDLVSENVSNQLASFSAYPVVKGFRHILQSEADDFMLGRSFQNGIACLQEHNFTYDLLIYPSQLKAAAKLVEAFPEQPFVLDHMAKPLIKEGKIKEWADDIRALSQFPKVSCKISGLITEAQHASWTYNQLIPYLDLVFDCFGINRLMFGSDWPVCLLAGNYDQVLTAVRNYTLNFSEYHRKLLFSENAKNFYNL